MTQQRRSAIELLQDKSRRHVTFSKRRTGLFKKASKASVSAGLRTAIVVFSSSGRLFTFAYPSSVDSVIDGFFTGQSDSKDHGFHDGSSSCSWVVAGLVGLQGDLEALRAQVLSRITEMKENVLREEKDEAMRKLELFLDDNNMAIHECAAEAALMRELEASLSQGCSHP